MCAGVRCGVLRAVLAVLTVLAVRGEQQMRLELTDAEVRLFCLPACVGGVVVVK